MSTAEDAIRDAIARTAVKPLTPRQGRLLEFARERHARNNAWFSAEDARAHLAYRHGTSDIRVCLEALAARKLIEVRAAPRISQRRYRVVMR